MGCYIFKLLHLILQMHKRVRALSRFRNIISTNKMSEVMTLCNDMDKLFY